MTRFFIIERGVPIPPQAQKGGGARDYQKHLGKMSIGDSMVLPCKTYTNAWSAAELAFGKGNFVCRIEGPGAYRIWRTG